MGLRLVEGKGHWQEGRHLLEHKESRRRADMELHYPADMGPRHQAAKKPRNHKRGVEVRWADEWTHSVRAFPDQV